MTKVFVHFIWFNFSNTDNTFSSHINTTTSSSSHSPACSVYRPQFTRCITSQLIKWFSNFREFYYIQMEKFARNALLEGVADVRDLTVDRESELFRALNVHYNKANDFQVPERFLEVAEITLREFYIAISVGKDHDPSWKKTIYKVICKLDSDVPPEFKRNYSE
ncbi:prospero homeobox protein 1 [Austrofundulus limnaeus]|uniref:Prospero homeobox protein 1 n=1 Tax=Austrofundulus limnaeus TaxID=52670 RepID=A0A2I4C4K7_AUSLI|nr:PREDICTED: prospero homeobox protein 1-like [Austrofundulus limnaeus]